MEKFKSLFNRSNLMNSTWQGFGVVNISVAVPIITTFEQEGDDLLFEADQDGTLYLVLRELNTPSAAQIIAGQDASGSAAPFAASSVVAVGETDISGLFATAPEGTYICDVVLVNNETGTSAVETLPTPLTFDALAPATFTTAATGPYLSEPSNEIIIGDDLTIEFVGTFTGEGVVIGQQSYRIDLVFFSLGRVRLIAKDDLNNEYVNQTTPNNTYAFGTEYTGVLSLSKTHGHAKFTLNGVVVIDATGLTITGDLDNGFINLLANFNGASTPAGEWTSFKIWTETLTDGSAPATAPVKTSAGDAATLNLDPWKTGTGDFT